MKTSINENIRKYRKEHKLTQEQLAEAMCVTVGAVSKWESGLSVPDISLIMELADFFGVSVDALLGYKMRNNDIASTAKRIKSLSHEKQFDKGVSEAEEALQKYPNSFDIVYESASLYLCMAIARQDEAGLPRALALFEHALTLIDQRHDSKVGKITIQKSMAEAYLALGEKEKGLELLKENNFDGVFDALIGLILDTHFKREDEALPYLSDSFVENLSELFQVVIGFANAFCAKKEYALGLEVLLWCKNIYDGLKIPGKLSYFDKSNVILLSGCAQVAAAMEDFDAARSYLTMAKKAADEFDANPDYSSKNIKFCFKDPPASFTDDFGTTAAAGIETAVLSTQRTAENTEENEKAETLIKIWEEVKSSG